MFRLDSKIMPTVPSRFIQLKYLRKSRCNYSKARGCARPPGQAVGFSQGQAQRDQSLCVTAYSVIRVKVYCCYG